MKKNSYNIPAGILFMCLALSSIYTLTLNSSTILGMIQLIFLGLIVWPLFGIFTLTKTNKGVLIIPALGYIFNLTLSLIVYSHHYSEESFISWVLSLSAMIFLIVMMYVRKNLKFVFFLPAVFYSIAFILTFGRGFEHYFTNMNNFMYIADEVMLIAAYLFCGLYLVTEDVVKKPTVAAPSPVANTYVPPIQSQTANKQEALLAYQKLFTQGFITEQEYEEKRKQILGL